MDNMIYMHYQHQKLERIVEQGVTLLSQPQPTLVLAHSFGGILAKTMIQRLRDAGLCDPHNDHIYKLVTMASPHTMNLFGVKAAKHALQTPQWIERLPTVTLGGYLDPVVFYRYTRMNQSTHYNFWSEHLSFLLFSRMRKRVLQELD